MKINEKIRSLRLERNLTQEDLAKAIGYQGRSAISKVEAGERKINHLMIVKLAHALNVSPAFLLCEDDEPFTCKSDRHLCGTIIAVKCGVVDMEMHEKIKQLRIQKGLTLEQVGDYVGVGKSTVRKWENGLIENMRMDKIAKLAFILGTTPDYLMGWGNSENIRYDDFIKLFSQLTVEQQDLIIASMKGILDNK